MTTSAIPPGAEGATIASQCGLSEIEIGLTHPRTSLHYLRERDRAIIAAFNAGLGPFGVARHFDLTLDGVTELLSGRSDIAPNRQWRRIPGSRETAVIAELWERYRSKRYISQQIGLHVDRIVLALNKSGVDRSKPEQPDQPPEGFLAGYSAGIGSFYQLCQCFCIPSRWGQRWVRDARPTRPYYDRYECDDVRTSLMDAGIEPPGYRHIVTNEDAQDTTAVKTGAVTTVSK
ncbi:hypothetical protein [Amycolatopsis lurida]|uniref:hypothetical protein n=1 Tax=Amycolatopsis lurida TaxID=31959 RepID=UPI003662ACA1